MLIAGTLTSLLLGFLPQETRIETFASGAKKAEYQIAFDDTGRERRHGPYRSWYDNGQLESEGAYKQGLESGPWVFRHENGERAASGRYADALRSGPWETFFPSGQRQSKGSYVRGAKQGRWSVWNEDGSKDLVDSGLYKLTVYRSKEDGRHYRGYVVDNLREGTWTSTWPDEAVQFEGAFLGGERQGPWVFTHPDGTPSSLLLSGKYHQGAWAGRISLPDPSPFEPGAFPEVEPYGRGWPEEREPLALALDTAMRSGVLGAELAAALVDLGPAAIPVVLERIRRLDPERAEDRAALGFLEHEALSRSCSGHRLSRFGAAGPPEAMAARELIRAWLSLWSLTRLDLDFWEAIVPGPSPPEAGLRDVLQDPPLLDRDPRFDPSARTEGSRANEPAAAGGPSAPPVSGAFRLRFGKEKTDRLRHAAAGTKESVTRALAWLAAHQAPEGHWSNAAFAAECEGRGETACAGPGVASYDVGATALALLAFLGDGMGPLEGQYASVVARGLEWLVHQQASEGLIGERAVHDFLYGHAIATAALCEGLAFGAVALRPAAERAVAFLQLGRYPGLAWRYDVPATEPGDTSITGWAVHALLAARHAGIAIEGAALTGALAWIDEMTDASTGRVGYSDRGELSARNSTNDGFPHDMGEPMTAVGLLLRLQLGPEPLTEPILAEHAKLIAARPPEVHKQWGADQYYWYYGTWALHEYGRPFWEAWELDVRKVVVLSQVQRGEAAGSWDPIGPWAYALGRVGATALMALTLEVPYRYPRRLEEK